MLEKISENRKPVFWIIVLSILAYFLFVRKKDSKDENERYYKNY